MFNSNVYDKDYAKATLGAAKDNLDDLEKWSVYNDDKANEEIKNLLNAFELASDAILNQ